MIQLYNASTGALKSDWTSVHSGHLALDSHGNLWVSPSLPGCIFYFPFLSTLSRLHPFFPSLKHIDITMYTPAGAKTTTTIQVRGGRGMFIHFFSNL
jgi:hypothetical protein